MQMQNTENMNLRKVLTSAVTSVLCAAMLAGCASGTNSTATASAAASTGPVNIVFAGWSGEEEASKAIFQKMMKTYEDQSGNTVTWVGWTWKDTAQQMLTRLQGGEQLDIGQTDIGIFNTVAASGQLADWNDILGKDYLQSTFEQSALDVGNVDGKQLGLPWSMASITMVYNPTLLKAAGWDKAPTTMDEFEKCLADIKAKNPDVIPYAVSTKDATCAGDFMPWLWTFGGAIFDDSGNVTINSDAAVKCVQWYQDMLAKGYIAMDTGRGEARQMFAKGTVAFYDDAVVAKGQAVSNGVSADKVVDVCSAMPRPVLKSGDTPQSTMWGHMLVTYTNSKYQQQAGDFAKTLVSDDVALDYFKNNGMPPVTKSAAASDTVKNDAYITGFINSTKTARLDETARMTNASQVKSVITEELQAALLGQKSAEQAVKDMESRLKAL